MENQDIKKQILTVATEMFTSHGYSKVSMDDLALRLGMSKRTLYKYFVSKEILLDEIATVFMDEILNNEMKILKDPELTFPDKIMKVLTFVATKMSTISPYFLEDISKNATSVWRKIQQYKSDAAFLRFNTLLIEGEKLGFIKKNTNKSLAVLLYGCAIETIFNPSFSRNIPEEMRKDLPYSPSAIFEGVVKIIFEGILVTQ